MPTGAVSVPEAPRWSGDLWLAPATQPLLEHLLRSGGGLLAGPVPSHGEPARAELWSDLLGVVVGSSSDRPPRAWVRDRFARDVERARRDLEPIPGVGALVSAYEREAFRSAARDPVALPRLVPARIAYAIRYVELSLGFRMPPWPSWLDADVRWAGEPRGEAEAA